MMSSPHQTSHPGPWELLPGSDCPVEHFHFLKQENELIEYLCRAEEHIPGCQPVPGSITGSTETPPPAPRIQLHTNEETCTLATGYPLYTLSSSHSGFKNMEDRKKAERCVLLLRASRALWAATRRSCHFSCNFLSLFVFIQEGDLSSHLYSDLW